MSRVAILRASASTVRYDYAPRSWESRHRGGPVDWCRKATTLVGLRKILKLGVTTAVVAGVLHAGVSYRIRQMGEERMHLLSEGEQLSRTVQSPPRSLALASVVGVTGQSAAPTIGASAQKGHAERIDAAPTIRESDASDVKCRRARQALSKAIADYNHKYPGTKIRSAATISLATSEYGDKPTCSGGAPYSLSFKGDAPIVRCPTHL